MGSGTGVQGIRASICPVALPVGAYGSEVGVSLVVVESASANFLAIGDGIALLTDGPRSRDADVPIRRGAESNDAERAVTHNRDYIGVPKSRWRKKAGRGGCAVSKTNAGRRQDREPSLD